jgi:tetratricopeptide (TPR) repeat protein
MLSAGESTDRAERRHRSQAERYASAAAAGTRETEILAASAFIELWLAYRAGDRNATARAERFTTRFSQSGELALLAWVMRGELAFAAEAWDEALNAYRYVLGQLEHPLYAYALYRTAETEQRAGRQEEAQHTFDEVIRLGCDERANEATQQMALRAARERGIGIRSSQSGVNRPENCSETRGADEATSGWRPAE